MVTLHSALTATNLGAANTQYYFNGKALEGVVKAFIYKGTSVTLTCLDKSVLPVAELKAAGIKVKEQR